MIVHPNNTYAIKQNNEEVKSGSLYEDFSPSVNPEEETEDARGEFEAANTLLEALIAGFLQLEPVNRLRLEVVGART